MESRELRVPTFREMLEAYPRLAEEQRGRTGGRPCKARVAQVVGATRILLRKLGWDEDRPYTDLTPKVMDGLFSRLKAEGLEAVSAKSYLEDVRGLAAKWSLFRYEEIGYKVETIRMPSLYVPPNRYRELSADMKKRILAAYEGLRDDPEAWFFATMMLKFGMRNSDVKRLSWDSFREESGGVYVTYVPHKTRLSSGRVVHWPVDDGTWGDILEYRKSHPLMPFVRGETVRPRRRGRPSSNRAEVAEQRVRAALRATGLSGGKTAYELRKLCACAVYKHFGQEAASSLLGDDISTILYHYADPSSVGKKVDISTLI